jgi:hypothetical protein
MHTAAREPPRGHRSRSTLIRSGEHATFETVGWNALDADGNVLRDTRTTYHLHAAPEEAEAWRFVSYTNHF